MHACTHSPAYLIGPFGMNVSPPPKFMSVLQPWLVGLSLAFCTQIKSIDIKVTPKSYTTNKSTSVSRWIVNKLQDFKEVCIIVGPVNPVNPVNPVCPVGPL